jgi:hypothetical protein
MAKQTKGENAMTFNCDDRVWYKENDSTDLGTVIGIIGILPSHEKNPYPYHVQWDLDGSDDWYSADQLVREG